MLNGTINVEGKTISDIELALEEALKRIKAGNTSGFDGNDEGSFEFQISGEEEPDEEKFERGDIPYGKVLIEEMDEDDIDA